MKKMILLIVVLLIPIISCSDSSEDYLGRGYESIVDEDYQAALGSFNKAIELDPNNVEAYNQRGVVLGILGDYDKALKDFNKAIEIDPNDSEAYKSRGITYLYLNEKTLGCLDLRIAKDKGNFEASGLIEEFCSQ